MGFHRFHSSIANSVLNAFRETVIILDPRGNSNEQSGNLRFLECGLEDKGRGWWNKCKTKFLSNIRARENTTEGTPSHEGVAVESQRGLSLGTQKIWVLAIGWKVAFNIHAYRIRQWTKLGRRAYSKVLEKYRVIHLLKRIWRKTTVEYWKEVVRVYSVKSKGSMCKEL